MQTKMEIADAFCKSVDIIIDRKLEKLAFNSTIVGRVKGKDDSKSGVYQIEYQDKTFTARALDSSQIYETNDYVYILVPNNAENRTRYIMSTVQPQGATGARGISLEEKIIQLEAEVASLKLEVKRLGGNENG